MTSTEGNTMFALAVYAIICTGLGLWWLVLKARDRWDRDGAP